MKHVILIYEGENGSFRKTNVFDTLDEAKEYIREEINIPFGDIEFGYAYQYDGKGFDTVRAFIKEESDEDLDFYDEDERLDAMEDSIEE